MSIREHAKDLLTRLTIIESTSGNECGIIEYLSNLLDKLSLSYNIQPIGSCSSNIIINDITKPRLVIGAHLDTVKVSSFPYQNQNFVYGTGSADDKASIASILLAIEELKSIPEDISIVFFSDEERGGSGSNFYLSNHRPHYALIMEPTNLHLCFSGFGSVEGTIFIKRKGIHPSMAMITNTDDAISSLRKIIDVLNDTLGFRGLFFVIYHILCGDENEFSIPSECKFSFDIGIPPEKVDVDVIGILYDLSIEYSFNFTIREVSQPFITNNDKFISFLKYIYTKTYNKNPDIWVMPSWTDAHNFSRYGIPVAIFGPGDLLYAHSENERVNIGSVIESSRFIELLLRSTESLE